MSWTPASEGGWRGADASEGGWRGAESVGGIASRGLVKIAG